MASITVVETRPTGTIADGSAYFESSTNKFVVYDATNASWLAFASDGTGAVYQNRWGLDFSSPTNSYLSLTPATFSTTSGFTLSAWVNFSSLPSDQEMMLGTVGNTQFWAFNPSNKYFYLKNSAGSLGYAGPWSGTPATNTWYHFMAIDTGTNVKAYINGSFVSNYAGLANTLGGSATFDTIARAGGRYMTGSIDDIAVWESDQTANISTIYGGGVPSNLSDLSPSAWWRMGDNSNDSASAGASAVSITDSSENGHDATQSDVTRQPSFADLTGETIYV